MEAVASMSGCSFRFHPSDHSLVFNFLLPWNLSNVVIDSSPIIEDDPYRIEPWNLLAVHEKDAEEGAYFLTKKVMLSSNGMRRKRTVGDANKILGTWRIQNCKNEWAAADRTVKLGWSKTLLSYYSAEDNRRTTGYVMHEYKLLENGGTDESSEMKYKYVICHVKLSDRETSRRKRRRLEESAAAAAAAAATSCSTTSGLSTSSLASASPASAASFGSDWTNSADFYPACAASPASLFGPTTLPAPNPHSVPSPALPSSSPWPAILPQPAAHEAPLVPASNVDEAALAPIPHEFPSDCFSSDFFSLSSFDTLDDDDDSYFFI